MRDEAYYSQWSDADLIAQLRAQAREALDPDLNHFLSAVGKRLADLSAEKKTVCSVAEMQTSSGADYFVSVRVGEREITPHMFKERWKAEYEVAEWKWLFGQAEKPDILAYGPDAKRRRPES